MQSESVLGLLRARFAAAITQVAAGASGAPLDPAVRAAQDPKFGDYQCNAAMGLAKALGAKPRDVAERISAAVDLDGIAEPLEVAGPGFINIRLRTDFLEKCLGEVGGAPQGSRTESNEHGAAVGSSAAIDATPSNRTTVAERDRAAAALFPDRLGIPPTHERKRVIADYSSPNIAKQMHVGHIRSTIIGDVIARVLTFCGHDVIRQNHVGDWGTQMGMVILGIWHICRKRNAPQGANNAAMIAYFEQGIECVARSAPTDARRAFLEDLSRKMEESLARRDGPDWPAWLKDFEAGCTPVQPTLDVLTAAYRFVNAVEDAPEAVQIMIPDPGRDHRPIPLARLSNHVVAEMLHARHDEELHTWRIARAVSIRDTQKMYDRLGVLLTPADVCGESFYHDRLAETVAELRKRLPVRNKSRPADGPYAELRDDQGAVCVFLYDTNHEPRFKNADGGELPMLIQKSDGAYLYATTDLAAVRFRVGELGGQRLIYVTAAPQIQHFQQFFAAARSADFAPPNISLEHVTFGSVLGEDRRPLKTRSGSSVRLAELLDEAEERALQTVEQREAALPPEAARMSPEQRAQVARVVGVSAVKYADLKNDRKTDYLFSWEKMLALQGNTAPYLLYAYARLRSILREAASRAGGPAFAPNTPVHLGHATERVLALRLLRLRESIAVVASELTPHVLCSYLYDLATDLTQFYEACPVLKAPDDATRASRLRLCDLAARTMRLGFQLLGIEPLERM